MIVDNRKYRIPSLNFTFNKNEKPQNVVFEFNLVYSFCYYRKVALKIKKYVERFVYVIERIILLYWKKVLIDLVDFAFAF